MMEIKIRAWDTDNHEIIGWDVLCEEGFGPSPQNFFLRHDRILMQYTGLRDKNGKEIYERDILKSPAYYQGAALIQNDTAEVVFNAGCFMAEGRARYFDLCESEVIGNAYENPELLNGK